MSIQNRDRLPDVVKYGTSREISVNITQKYRIPDIGNTSFGPQTQIIFKPEYGNNFFMDVNESYMTANFTCTSTNAGTTGYNSTVQLDCSIDALFNELTVSIGNTQVEFLQRYNR